MKTVIDVPIRIRQPSVMLRDKRMGAGLFLPVDEIGQGFNQLLPQARFERCEGSKLGMERKRKKNVRHHTRHSDEAWRRQTDPSKYSLSTPTCFIYKSSV